MTPARVPRRPILFSVVFAAWLLVVVGGAAATPAAPGASSDGGAGAADRVAPRTLNPFTAMDCVSATKVWAVSLEANMRTTDGGATWKPFSLPGEMRYDPQAVDFVTSKVGYIVAVDTKSPKRGVVLKTTNGGAKWTVKLRASVDLLAGVCFQNTQKGWVVGRAGCIYKTSNGGKTWIAQSAANVSKPTLYSVSFADATHGWAVGAAGTVMKTSNGGRTWSKKAVSANDLYGVDFVNASRGWTVGGLWTETGGIGEIYVTANGGKTWTAQTGPGGTAPPVLACLDFWNKDAGILGGIGSLLYTANGGSAWLAGTPAPSGIAAMGVKMANAKVGFAACTNYTIVMTMDGGATWMTVLSPTPMR
jgi:photosystem II stability/assembly factor-like uncharacterized protein